MLQRDPEKRVASAAEVVDRLRPFAFDDSLTTLGQETLAVVDRLDESEALHESAIDGSSDQGSRSPRKHDRLDRWTRPVARRNRQWFGVIGLVALILIAGALGAFAGVTIILKTGEGELVVESEVEDITLELIPDGASVPSLQVQSGKTTTIRSGRYELRVAGASDSVTVDPQIIVVRRGDRRVVSVRRKTVKGSLKSQAQGAQGEAAALATPNDATTWEEQLRIRHGELKIKLARQSQHLGENHPGVVATHRELDVIEQLQNDTVDAPTHKGRTYAQWQRIVLRETETTTVLDAIKSLVRLSHADQHDKTIETLFRVAEKVSGELPTSMANRDAHIDLNAHWGEDESSSSGRQYFKPGPESWKSIMSQLVEELDELPLDAIDRQLRVAVSGENEAEQLFVIAYLASRMQAERPLDGGVSLIDQLASQRQSDLVTAVAMFVQLALSKTGVSERHVDQLRRNSPLVAPAVLSAMLRTDQFTAMEEMGRVGATSVFHAGSTNAYAKDALMESVFDRQTDESPPRPQPEETEFLRAYGKHLVKGWQETETQSFPGLFSIFKLGGLDLLDDAARQLADQQLMSGIQQLLAERARLKSVTELRSEISGTARTPWLLDLTNTLLHVRGEFPIELRDDPLDTTSALGTEFAKWEAALDTSEQSKDRHVWMIWYPLETSEAYLRQWGREPKPATSQFSPSLGSIPRVHRNHDVLPEIAIAVAATRTSDAELQSGLAVCLQIANQRKGWLSWVTLPKYRDLLHTTAFKSVVPSARAAALALARRGGLDDEVCKRIAFELLDADLSQTDKENVLATLALADSLELTPPTFERLYALVGRRTMRIEPYVHVLQIMEKSRVVTPKGLKLLRASLGSREKTVQLPRQHYTNIGRPSRSSVVGELKFAAPSVPPELARQALATTQALGPQAKETLPAIEAMLVRMQRFSPNSSTELQRELRATIKLLQAELPPQDSTNEKPAPEPGTPE
jgi:hypothetical protein